MTDETIPAPKSAGLLRKREKPRKRVKAKSVGGVHVIPLGDGLHVRTATQSEPRPPRSRFGTARPR